MMKKPLQNETALVKKAKMGDEKAFATLVAFYEDRVMKLINRYVDDQHQVLDLTQETFIKVYRALQSFRGDSAFYTWVYRVAINTAKNFIVYQKRHPPMTDIDYEEAEQGSGRAVLKEFTTPEKIMLKDEVEAAIFDTLDGLPEELRVALILREMQGFTYDDIADVMDCPIGTVRSRIFRSREIIENKLAEILCK